MSTTAINAYNTVTQGAAGRSNWIVLNGNLVGSSLGILAVATGTLTFSIEYTMDPISNPTDSPANFNTLSGFSAKTATADGTTLMPLTGVRINITSFTSGSVVLIMRQNGVVGMGTQ